MNATMLSYQEFINQEVKKIEEKETVHSFGCAMLFFDFPDIKELHSQITAEDVFTDANDPSFGLEDEPHCTLLYGLHEEVSDSAVQAITDKHNFSECRISEVSLFENADFDVLKFNVSGDSIHECNEELATLPHTNKYPDYHPHLTVAYLLPGTGKKYVEKFKDLSYELVPTHCVYSKPDGSTSKLAVNTK